MYFFKRLLVLYGKWGINYIIFYGCIALDCWLVKKFSDSLSVSINMVTDICREYMSVGISLYGNRLSVGISMSVGISYTNATYNDRNVVLAYIYTNWWSVGTTAFTNWRSVSVLGLWYSGVGGRGVGAGTSVIVSDCRSKVTSVATRRTLGSRLPWRSPERTLTCVRGKRVTGEKHRRAMLI
jgi:hypothetical protein